MEEQQPGQVIVPGTQAQNTAQSATTLPEVEPTASVPPETAQVEVKLNHDEQPPAAQVAPVAEQPAAYAEPDAAQQAESPAPPQNSQDMGVDSQTEVLGPDTPVAPVDSAFTAQEQPAPVPSQQPMPGEPDLAWTAQEYEHDERGAVWYLLYLLGSALIGAAVYFLTKDIVSAVVVCMAAAGLIYIVARKPRDQTFVLDNGQLAIGKSVYVLHSFKAFAIDEHGKNIVLLPMKRFLPPITIYVGDQYRETVSAYLAQYLPTEQHVPDAVDKLLRKIHL